MGITDALKKNAHDQNEQTICAGRSKFCLYILYRQAEKSVEDQEADFHEIQPTFRVQVDVWIVHYGSVFAFSF